MTAEMRKSYRDRLDMNVADPMPYVAPDGCRFPTAELPHDSNIEHCSLEYSPRWLVG